MQTMLSRKAIDKVRRAGLRPALDSPIGMGRRFWWRAERWHTQSGPEARAPLEGVDDFVNGPVLSRSHANGRLDQHVKHVTLRL